MLLPASIGSIMGTEAVKLITGIREPLLGRLMVVRRIGHTTVPDCENSQAPADHRGHRVDRLRLLLRHAHRRAAEAAKDSTISVKDLQLMLEQRERGNATSS